MNSQLERERDALLAQWIDSYSNRLTQLAYTYLRDWGKAEDATQEAFVKAYRSMHQLNNLDQPYPWIARIVINECKMMLRRSRREVITSLLPEETVLSSEDEYFYKSDSERVHDSILALPEKYRTPIVLYYIQELSTQEIAEVMGIRPGTVRIRLMRGRERLRLHLERGEKGEYRRKNSKFQAVLLGPHGEHSHYERQGVHGSEGRLHNPYSATPISPSETVGVRVRGSRPACRG
ncbi:RNA polymerase sigma factor [Alicyclobacillus kakegawensis]|uniref:RNA polymerase sigma factor n=1 Tax=Alicyclobacillus kakegawensis TaxID=392012 RepID=UPI0009F99C0E|nr:sigma-70 family RNA polymerase sigma factor [Alicyclobacillus kakegawensis]